MVATLSICPKQGLIHEIWDFRIPMRYMTLALQRKLINTATPEDRTQWSSGRALAWCVGGHWFNSWLGHTKDFKNIIGSFLA